MTDETEACPTWEDAVMAALDAARLEGGVVHVHPEGCPSARFGAPNTLAGYDRGDAPDCDCEVLELDPAQVTTRAQVRDIRSRGGLRFVQ